MSGLFESNATDDRDITEVVVVDGYGGTLNKVQINAQGELRVQDIAGATEATLTHIDGKLNTLGQKTMAGSVPVVLASNQPAIPVTGILQANVSSSNSSDILGTNIHGVKNNQIEITFSDALDSNVVTTRKTNPGTSITTTNGHTIFSTGTHTNASVEVSSVATAKYRPSHEMYAYFTASFTTPTSINSYQKIGIYNTDEDTLPALPTSATDGFALGYFGLDFGVAKYFNGIQLLITAANFNTDPLDGSPSSKFTRDGTAEAIDYTNSNLYRIRFAWLGSASISFEVFSPDGVWVQFHVIKQPNTELNPSITTPNLKMYLQLNKTNADSTNLNVSTACWAAGTTSDLEALNSTLTDYTLASLTRSVLTGRTTAGGSAYVNVKVAPSGSLMTALGSISDVAGQSTMTNSLPVTIASDQSTLPVSFSALPGGTNNIGDVDVVSLPGTVEQDITTTKTALLFTNAYPTSLDGGNASPSTNFPQPLRFDNATSFISYKGEAIPGTSPSVASWRISRISTDISGSIIIEWADGNTNFDNIWDNRASLSYS